jgi:hypothetical protein
MLDEETLHDFLILQLKPHFESSATGETFNNSGKADILMRYEKSNVFVAECQLWKGPETNKDKIDRLLGHLPWCDSKSALITFVDRQDFMNTLTSLRISTMAHICFLKETSSKEETRHNYIFHLPGDLGREIKIATLTFHSPKLKSL